MSLSLYEGTPIRRPPLGERSRDGETPDWDWI
jgi:hypothetical protein